MLPDRTISSLLLAFSIGLLACGGDDDNAPPTGPYDEIPLGQTFQFEGVTGTVHVARDEFGIAHIHAENGHDLFFALGYVMAHDRLPQMDILRRFGAGTVAELFGIDEGALESDLEMRIHRMKPTAELALAELRQSADPDDADLVIALEAFSDGVNHYVTDVNAGKWTIDDRLLASFDPQRFEPWQPTDSLVLGRFQAFALSWTAPFEIEVTDIYQTATEVFDQADPDSAPELAARAGAAADFTRLVPVDRVPTIDGFPNVDVDTGTRSNDLSGAGSSARRAAAASAPSRAVAAPSPTRPHVPRHLLSAARRTFRAKAFGPHGFMVPQAGSNNWAVGPQHTGGKALLAGDPHLSLPNPSIFYPVHLVIPGELDVEGSTFPGIPGVLHGHNGDVAWASTVVYHDVNDIYLENIAPCPDGGGDCVLYGDEAVPIETWQETVNLGALGTIFDTRTITYERVPHHGHLIPEIADGAIVPRAGDQALSVRYTGHRVTHEIRFLWKLNRARSIPEAFASLTHFQFGGQNWMFIDRNNDIGWSTHVDVPRRDAAAYSWHPTDAPDGLTPTFVLPGTGGAEWDGWLSPRYIPHAYNPPSGYLVTANSDPVGATFDGIPHDEPLVDGRPLFAGAAYATGLRSGRIDRRLQALIDAGAPITLDDMAAIQTDSYSNAGARFVPHIADAAAAIDGDTHADVTAWLATLDAARVQRLRDAAGLLSVWSFETPPAVQGAPSTGEIDDSAATTIFNVWAHYFMGRALGDEYARLDWNVYDTDKDMTVRPMLAVLEEPDTLHTGLAPETGEPILCDSLDTAEVESCTLIVLQALDDALVWLASSDGLATDDMSEWRWGKLHTLTLEPLFPETSLNVPPPNDPNPDLRNGYPRPGDNWVVNRADGGWNDTNFTHTDGPAQRMLVEVADGRTHARLALPGGTIYDPSSPHYRDLADTYYTTNTYFDVPYTPEEIVAHGEDRWLIRGE